ncbi:hypothetical protein CT0861_02333 [Colletotrichum tofieldiae]|uniref:PD-(D/E)XK nuclease-like domain-containing protein n=1 Tax=Colletotrichum tofieldiae TaxID=708197 RepID=A0A166MBS1_9PEZI|nr:hypothetical protein CT0861_02333 [Colletotrichum tofieldiae]
MYRALAVYPHLVREDTVDCTSCAFLRNKPITVSIDTKKSEGLEEPILQIGVWHAAHWAYLDRISKMRNTDLDGLGFLPGLNMGGADWYSVASTRQGHKTTLWNQQLIGSKESLIGAYKVVRAIQYLAWWSNSFY